MTSFIWPEMTDKVTVITPKATLAEAATLMRTGSFRHLPVVDGQKLVGMLSDRDVLRYQSSATLAVGEVMSRQVKTCGLNSQIGEVTDAMLSYGIDALPVVDERGGILGIVTSTDLLKYLRRTHTERRTEPFEHLLLDLNDIGDVED